MFCNEDAYNLMTGEISKIGSEYFVKSLKWFEGFYRAMYVFDLVLLDSDVFVYN